MIARGRTGRPTVALSRVWIDRAAFVEICWEMIDRIRSPKWSGFGCKVQGPTRPMRRFKRASLRERCLRAFWNVSFIAAPGLGAGADNDGLLNYAVFPSPHQRKEPAPKRRLFANAD